MHTVAVIDDERNIRSLIKLALGKEGYNVTEYSDGESAWIGLQTGMPDVIVLDIMMPRMNGLELCRRIKEVNPSVPVIFLSSRDDEYDKVLGLDSGGDDYVCKPFSMMELTARIRAAVRRSGAAFQTTDAVYDIECGPLSMCTPELAVSWKGAQIKLSVTEYRILSYACFRPRNGTHPGAAYGGRVS